MNRAAAQHDIVGHGTHVQSAGATVTRTRSLLPGS